MATVRSGPWADRVNRADKLVRTAADLTATPASQAVTAGTAATVTATWTGLTAGQRYLGRISSGDGTASAGGTVIRVDA